MFTAAILLRRQALSCRLFSARVQYQPLLTFVHSSEHISSLIFLKLLLATYTRCGQNKTEKTLQRQKVFTADTSNYVGLLCACFVSLRHQLEHSARAEIASSWCKHLVDITRTRRNFRLAAAGPCTGS